MKKRKAYCTFLFIFLCNFAIAGKIEKAFERLKAFDYFNAKTYFEKTLDYETAASAYGLSVIYSTNDNPFYNIDEARKFILISDSSYRTLKDKTKKFYAQLGVTDSAITLLSYTICEDAFRKANTTGSVDSYNHYLRNYAGCSRFQEAYLLRDSAAFDDAKEVNSSEAFKTFMVNYPQSQQYKEALDKYDESIYRENTREGEIESYKNFIRDFPENRYRVKAEERIYKLSVPDKRPEQFAAFAREFPQSTYAKDAWREVYKLSMKDYSMESYNNFKDSFPDYPYQEEFESDFRLQNYFFLPVREGNHWGYINEFGREMIEPIYDEAGLFSDGLAMVMQNGNYGFVNKSGNLVINFKFKDAEPFHSGFAVVMKDSLYGLINKDGEFIIQPLYDELAETGSELYIAAKKDMYGYLYRNGVPLTPFEFEIANDFKNGAAIVSKQEKYGVLNTQGNFSIRPQFEELVFINDTLMKALNEDELWGIITLKGDTLLPFIYDAIGEFNDHRALVARGGKCGYIDESGVVVIPLTFGYSPSLLTTGQFQNGYALLKQKSRTVLIDKSGKTIKVSGCDDYKIPSMGFIPVRKAGKWGYANMNGKIVIPCVFQMAESFTDTLAIVRKGNVAGVIDTTGNIFIQPLYDEIVFYPKAISVKSKERWGLLSQSGTLYLPCNYDNMELLNQNLVSAKNNRGYTYVNLVNGKIIYSPRD